MKRYWVRVNCKHNAPHDATVTAVYGTLKDAKSYAVDHECHSWDINVVEIFDDDMNLVETFEF